MSRDGGLLMLGEVTRMVVESGPVSSRVGAGVLQALSGILQERRTPLSPRTLQALTDLVDALREDLG